MRTASFKDVTAQNPETPESKAYKQIFGAKKTKTSPAYPGQPDVAVKAVCDYVEMYPDGKEKAGKPRGKINLCQYVHTQGARSSNERVINERLWDLELFVVQMYNLRRWPAAKARAEFAKLDASIPPGDSERRDMGGPPESPLRLAVPSWMTGEDSNEGRKGTFEQKVMNKMSKMASALSEEMQQQMINETRLGFTQPVAPVVDLHRPLPMGALTSERQDELKSGVELLMKIAKDTNLESAEALVPAAGDEAGGNQAAGASPAGSGFADIGSTRNKATSAIKKDIGANVARLTVQAKLTLSTLSEGDHLENHQFYNSAKERAQASLTWLGKCVDFEGLVRDGPTAADAITLADAAYPPLPKPTAAAGSNPLPALPKPTGAAEPNPPPALPKPTAAAETKPEEEASGAKTAPEPAAEAAEGAPEQAAEAEASEAPDPSLAATAAAATGAAAADPAGLAATLAVVVDVDAHNQALSDFLQKLVLKPVERPGDMLSSTAVKAIVDTVASATELSMISNGQAIWETQKLLVTQLTSSLRTARTDLVRENKSHAARQEKAAADKKAAEAEKAKKEQALIAERNRKLLRASKECTITSLELVTMGHASVKQLNDDAGFTEYLDKAKDKHEVWSVPFVVKCSELFTTACSSHPVFKDTFQRWTQSFPEVHEAKKYDKTGAPAKAPHGIAAMTEAMTLYMPKTAFVDPSSMPSLKAATQDPWFFGYTATLASADFESDFLGSLRWQLTGSVKLIMIPVTSLLKVVPKDGVGTKKAWADRAREALRGLSEEVAKAWHEKGAQLFIAEASENSVIYTPPGWLVFTKVTSDDHVAGLRQSVLANTAAAEQNMKEMASLAPGESTLADFADCIALWESKRQ